ncbi:UNVERIFIED_CONTAM: hypothetical protein Scaly_2246900 [Sesamum calycinum]|uniref:Uncharacterized protein n=1 Tax=Sesamum calycinum TaxID=2727403 RepID=A0AAW2MAZ1_9LAMI
MAPIQMIDEKPIMDQIHEYENLVADAPSEGMKMCEILQANVLPEKFPPMWSEYRNHLKHKKRDLTLQELIGHMRTEKANSLKDKATSLSSLTVKDNLVESSRSKDRFHQNKRKRFQKNNQHKLFKGPDEANQVENKNDEVLDTGTSRHFCSNKTLFHELVDAMDDERVFIRNSTAVEVLGKGYLSDSIETIEETKRFSSAQFDMKDLGEVDGARTPYDQSMFLKKNKGDTVSHVEYVKIIGSVMFLMNYTRSDIVYAGTMNLSLHFNNFPAVLEGYCDANWVTDNDEVKKQSGWKTYYDMCPCGGQLYQCPSTVIPRLPLEMPRNMPTMAKGGIFASAWSSKKIPEEWDNLFRLCEIREELD